MEQVDHYIDLYIYGAKFVNHDYFRYHHGHHNHYPILNTGPGSWFGESIGGWGGNPVSMLHPHKGLEGRHDLRSQLFFHDFLPFLGWRDDPRPDHPVSGVEQKNSDCAEQSLRRLNVDETGVQGCAYPGIFQPALLIIRLLFGLVSDSNSVFVFSSSCIF